MSDRELTNKLSSGELSEIKLGGTTSGKSVTTIDFNDAKYASLALINAGHTLQLDAYSLAANQQPTLTDTPLKIEFGAAQVTANIDLSAAGDITFKTSGKYIIHSSFHYGRTGATGVSILYNRLLINGSQLGESLAAKLDNAEVLVPFSNTMIINVLANDVLTFEIVRDSAGANFGGVFTNTPAIGWNPAYCASIDIYNAV
jgi:hypothetical protein